MINHSNLRMDKHACRSLIRIDVHTINWETGNMHPGISSSICQSDPTKYASSGDCMVRRCVGFHDTTLFCCLSITCTSLVSRHCVVTRVEGVTSVAPPAQIFFGVTNHVFLTLNEPLFVGQAPLTTRTKPRTTCSINNSSYCSRANWLVASTTQSVTDRGSVIIDTTQMPKEISTYWLYQSTHDFTDEFFLLMCTSFARAMQSFRVLCWTM